MLRAPLVLLAVLVAACRVEPHPAVAQPVLPTTPEHADALADAVEQVTIGAVRWFVDYDAALRVARAQDRALWVHFGENPG